MGAAAGVDSRQRRLVLRHGHLQRV
jgi:hypothetical protein